MRPTPKYFRLRALLAWFALATAFSTHGAESSSSLDAATRRDILDCTFEVISIMRDGDGRPSVWLVGSAYCVGDGTLATAAHVFDQALGGRYDPPVIRDRNGRTYPIDQVLRYSMPDDFVVFTATGLETRRAPPRDTSDAVTERLYVASRSGDGDLALTETQFRGRTSMATYGRDGWIQYGPASGHGSSGGGLLDEHGRLVGIIRSRSSERDDAIAFAIPIAHIEAASTREGAVGMSDPMTVLDMPSIRNQRLLGGVPLPAAYPKFARDLMQVRETYFSYMLPYSLSLEGADAALSDEQRERLCVALGSAYCDQHARGPLLEVAQRADTSRADPSSGCDIAWVGVGAALIRCPARDARSAERLVDSIRAQAEAAALGRDALQREDGPCLSSDPLEPAGGEDSFADSTGAQWRIRAWPVRACDWTIVAMSRADAAGMLTLVRGAPSGYASVAAMQLKMLTLLQCEHCTRDASGAQSVVIAEASAPTRDAPGPDASVADHPRATGRKHSAAVGGGGSTGLLAR